MRCTKMEDTNSCWDNCGTMPTGHCLTVSVSPLRHYPSQTILTAGARCRVLRDKGRQGRHLRFPKDLLDSFWRKRCSIGHRIGREQSGQPGTRRTTPRRDSFRFRWCLLAVQPTIPALINPDFEFRFLQKCNLHNLVILCLLCRAQIAWLKKRFST